MPTVAELAHTTDGRSIRVVADRRLPKVNEDSSEQFILGLSRKVWEKAVSFCNKNGVPTVQWGGQEFYDLRTKPMAYFIAAATENTAYHDGTQRIYDFLRATTNAQFVPTDAIGNERSWLIRPRWVEAGNAPVFRKGRAKDRIDLRAARLTPAEAGEDRDPLPVTITHKDPAVPPTKITCDLCPDRIFKSAHAAAGHKRMHSKPQEAPMSVKAPQKRRGKQPGERPAPPVEGKSYITLENGRVQCAHCPDVFDTPASIPPHAKRHANERRDAEVQSLQAEITRLRRRPRKAAEGTSMDAERAVQVLSEVIRDSGANAEREALLRAQAEAAQTEIARLTAEVTDLRANGDGQALQDLIRGVLASVYAGTTGISRALADIEDLVVAP